MRLRSRALGVLALVDNSLEWMSAYWCSEWFVEQRLLDQEFDEGDEGVDRHERLERRVKKNGQFKLYVEELDI